MLTTPVEFRFDAAAHEYYDLVTGELLPHITGILEETGWVDTTWFTDESSERGQAVHTLTADYDLGAIEDPVGVDSAFKGWLLAHVKAMSVLRPEILAVEQPLVHPVYRFGGRPDRDAILYGTRAVLELKSGAPHKAHPIQTALQAILVSHDAALPPETIQRFCLYLKRTGKFRLDQHRDRRDFDEAFALIHTCCRRAA